MHRSYEFAGTGIHEEGHSAAYGEDDIQHLTAQFAPTVVDKDATLTEWRTWKETMRKDNTVEGKSAQEVVHLLVSTPSHVLLYPNLASLACAALVLPMSTVDCERGISALGRIKSKLRNRLAETSLNNLLFISIEGPPLQEFDFDEAVTNWGSKKMRCQVIFFFFFEL